MSNKFCRRAMVLPSDGNRLAVIGIDPGGTIGFGGCLRDQYSMQDRYLVKTFDNIVNVWSLIAQGVGEMNVKVVIEDFVGMGPRNRDSNLTIKQIGFIQYSCELWGIPCEVAPPQTRKSELERAVRIVQDFDDIPTNKKRHAADALAHALVEVKRANNG